MADIADFLATAQRLEMIMSKTMSRVVPGLAVAAAIAAGKPHPPQATRRKRHAACSRSASNREFVG